MHKILYVIGISEKGPFKIGVTGNLKRRLEILQTGSPSKIQVIQTFDFGANARAVELGAHRLLAGCRLEGEWFAAPASWILNSVDRAHRALSETQSEEGFGLWLAAQAGRDDAVGDLACDVARDVGRNRPGSFDDIGDRIRLRNGCGEAMEALNIAFAEWMQTFSLPPLACAASV